MTDRENHARKGERHMKRWPIAQKYRIVEETFVPGASVAIVARRNNVNANQVFGWRKKYREGRLVEKKKHPVRRCLVMTSFVSALSIMVEISIRCQCLPSLHRMSRSRWCRCQSPDRQA